jgi:hypothetical protein
MSYVFNVYSNCENTTSYKFKVYCIRKFLSFYVHEFKVYSNLSVQQLKIFEGSTCTN